jgi:hypothetical protein
MPEGDGGVVRPPVDGLLTQHEMCLNTTAQASEERCRWWVLERRPDTWLRRLRASIPESLPESGHDFVAQTGHDRERSDAWRAVPKRLQVGG